MKARFQIAECSLSNAKIRRFAMKRITIISVIFSFITPIG